MYSDRRDRPRVIAEFSGRVRRHPFQDVRQTTVAVGLGAAELVVAPLVLDEKAQRLRPRDVHRSVGRERRDVVEGHGDAELAPPATRSPGLLDHHPRPIVG